jgi:hypothetical protein
VIERLKIEAESRRQRRQKLSADLALDPMVWQGTVELVEAGISTFVEAFQAIL